MAGLTEFLFGSKDKIKKLPTMNPQQQQLLNSILGQVLGMQGQGGGYGNALDLLQQYLDPQSDVYQNFEQPYLQQYEQETIPNIAERFAGAGALSSSGFGQALSSAGANLQTNLAQLKSGMQRQSIQDLFNQFNQLSQFGLGASPFAYQNKKGSMGLFPTALGSFFGSEGFTSGLASKIF